MVIIRLVWLGLLGAVFAQVSAGAVCPTNVPKIAIIGVCDLEFSANGQVRERVAPQRHIIWPN
jgi:hypothetical protein